MKKTKILRKPREPIPVASWYMFFDERYTYYPTMGLLTLKSGKPIEFVWHDGIPKIRFKHYSKKLTHSIALHRLAWLLHYQTLPKLLRLKDHDYFNLKITNIVPTTNRELSRLARKTPLPRTSNFKGVCLMHGRWRAALQIDRSPIHLGYFDTEEEAAKAYDVKARELGYSTNF